MHMVSLAFGLALILLVTFHNLFSSEWLRMFEFSSQLHRHSWLFIEKWLSLYLELRVSRLCTIFSSTFTYFITKDTYLKTLALLSIKCWQYFGVCLLSPRHFTSKNDNLLNWSPKPFLSYMCLHSPTSQYVPYLVIWEEFLMIPAIISKLFPEFKCPAGRQHK